MAKIRDEKEGDGATRSSNRHSSTQQIKRMRSDIWRSLRGNAKGTGCAPKLCMCVFGVGAIIL